MLGTLVERIGGAYAAPRLSARRLLQAEPKFADAVAMALAGAVLGALLVKTVEFAAGRTVLEAFIELSRRAAEAEGVTVAEPGDPPNPYVMVLENLFVAFSLFIVASILAWRIGGWAGGKARFEQVAALSGWWLLISAPMGAVQTALLLWSLPDAGAIGIGVGFGLEIFLIYLYAAFLAEAHGFKNAGEVTMVVMGVGFITAVLVFTILAALGGGGGQPGL